MKKKNLTGKKINLLDKVAEGPAFIKHVDS